MKALCDIAAERAVLSAICQFGENSFLDVSDIITNKTFTVDYNQLIYSCIKHTFNNNQTTEIDVASIYSAGEELGIGNILLRPEILEHINSLFNFPVNQNNIRKFAAKIRKLEIARQLREKLKTTSDSLLELNGTENISHILGIAETSVFEFSSSLNSSNEEPKKIYDGLSDYINYLGENTVDQIGISTGFPEYDKAIGGGLRPGTINVIGARTKIGKSLISSAIGYHIAKEKNIPVLNMDTEMTYEDHIHRLLAMASECFIYDIETGKFTEKPHQDKKLRDVVRKIEDEKIPYYHKSIAGMQFEEQMAIMRRWIIKEVGLNNSGHSNPCVIIYDYLKLMDSNAITSNVAEFQALGFIMSSLHNFTVKYKIPILALIQLNRDGINKEGTDVASGSDRIIWLCSNFTILKQKSDEEISQDGIQNGNRKLVPIVCRHGAGIEDGNYINCFMQGSIGKISEGKTKFQLLKEQQQINIDSEEGESEWPN